MAVLPFLVGALGARNRIADDQDELADKLKTNKFSNVEYRNLSNGIAAIHSAWKI